MQYGEFATTLSQEIDGDEKFRATMFARCWEIGVKLFVESLISRVFIEWLKGIIEWFQALADDFSEVSLKLT